jgi:hypothetical protein
MQTTLQRMGVRATTNTPRDQKLDVAINSH